MTQRRILIGSMIGILTFTLLSWVSPNTWNVLESQLLQGRSQLRLFNPFAKVNYLVIEFNGDNQSDFENKSSSEQKETLMNLVSELAAREAKSITIAINKSNPLDIDNIDLETALGALSTQARTIRVNDIETIMQQESGPALWLDRKQHDLQRHGIDDLFNDVIPQDSIRNQNIIIVSPRLELSDEDLNLVVNHLSDRWVTYIPMPSIIKFILFIAIGIFMAALVYWARIVSFFALSILAMVIGQLALTLLNVHIETISFIVSLISILLLSNLFDLNLSAAMNRRNFFLSQQDKNNDINNPAILMTTPFIQAGAATKLEPESIKEMRAKFFHEQESNFEDIALEFQEKTIRSVNSVQEKIEELTESETLSERDRTKLSLLKHNFDHMIEEMDAILFNLVPFRFENDKGLVGLIELYASKLFLLSRGKLQISIETQFPSLKLELDQKINSYRIIQRLIELIKTINDNKASSGMVISINIHSTANGKLKFRISYEGTPVDANANNFKINEVYKRIAGLNDGNIDFGTGTAATASKNLTNHIEFQFKTSAIKTNLKKEATALTV